MPVYNAEKFLKEAIESVLEQTFTDWELICIDDGSTDNSGKILDQFMVLDSRIHVYHNTNHGVAYSRQFGIERAKYTFCSSLDSDDWMEPDMLQVLVDKAEETRADIVWCDIYVNKTDLWSFACEQDPCCMIKKILRQEIWGSLCNKIIKTEICQNPKVKFPAQCTMWEDMSFMIQSLLLTNKIVYVPKPLYHYRQVSDSLTHQNNKRIMCYEYQKAVDSIAEAFSNLGEGKYNKELITLQLFVLKDYIDDKRIRNYEKFRTVYPEAYSQIMNEDGYPFRLKASAWLINHGLSFFIPIVCRFDSLLRRINIHC